MYTTLFPNVKLSKLMSAGLGIFIMGLGATCGVLSTMYPGRNNILIHWTPKNIL